MSSEGRRDRSRSDKLLRLSLAAIIFLPLLFFFLNFLFPLRDQIFYTTLITDNQGEVLHAFLTKDEKWRMKTGLDEISPVLRKAIIEKEDKYFYYHPGINPLAVVRAALRNIVHRKRTSGASTITMQVARMLEPRERTYTHKLVELFRAFQLEWKYSKDEILQLYLNLVPYGGNIEGVKSAAVLFFNKNPNHLSLAEVTALSIIPNRPSSLRLGYHNERILRERNRWLLRFKRAGLFSAAEIEDALAEPLTARRIQAPKTAPHLALKLKKSVPQTEVQTGISRQMQLKLEKLTNDYMRPLRSLRIFNAAVIVVDNKSREVKAYIGSADFNDATDGGQVNGASAIRQPGSTLKPLIYGLCFDHGTLTPKTMMTDVPININGFAPENYDEQFHGYVTAQFALENSLNIPAVKALNSIGVRSLTAELKKTGFRQIARDENKLGLSVALGGCGVSLEEMTALYCTIANEGLYAPLKFTTRPDDSTTRVLSASASFMLTEILSKLARPDLPVNWEASAHTPRIAWKTGTSYGRRDAWSIGFNKKYTVGVWVGNFSGEGVQELNGANMATPLLFKIFHTIDYNSPNEWFRMPAACGVRLVCSETGMLPGSYCSNIVMDYYLPLVSANATCNNRMETMISADEKISYCHNCKPENGYRKKVYRITPPEMQSYFEEHRIAYEKIPQHNPECDKLFQEGAPSVTSPLGGTEYLINSNDPEPLQMSCDATSDVKTVYWYINNELYRSCSARNKIFFQPPHGRVKISCSDDKGRNTDIFIQVKYVRF